MRYEGFGFWYMQRIDIKNRHGLKLVIQVDTPDNPKDLVFIAHGQGGFMGQVHIEAFAEAFLENNFRVVRFDATHAMGESEGDMFDVTYDSYVEDLEDVISWAKAQTWIQEPFALCGASMGAQSTTWYAEHHSQDIQYLVALAPPVNFDLWIKKHPEHIKGWQEKGYVEMISKSKPGLVKKVGWGVNESLKKYDLLPLAEKLTMPVLFMSGEFDTSCPVEIQEVLFNSIPSQNKIFIKTPNAEHNFRNHKTDEYGQELQEAKEALGSWLRETTLT